jgi:hypothetical protein
MGNPYARDDSIPKSETLDLASEDDQKWVKMQYDDSTSRMGHLHLAFDVVCHFVQEGGKCEPLAN